MPPEDLTIPINCSNGAQYLLNIGEMKNLPENIPFPVFDVALIKVQGEETTKCLYEVGTKIIEYLKIYPQVILYFMYDDKEIYRSKNHSHLNPQEYRSKLFNVFFKRYQNQLYHKNIKVDVDNNGNCLCWTLASLHSNSGIIDKVSDEIYSFASK